MPSNSGFLHLIAISLLAVILAISIVAWYCIQDLSARKKAARLEAEMLICHQAGEGQSDRFWILPESQFGLGRRVANCSKERTEALFSYVLESQKQDEWNLIIGGRVIPGSSGNAPEQYEFHLTDREVIPIGSSTYRVSRSVGGMRLDAVDLAEHGITLQKDCWRICGNSSRLSMIPEVANGVRQEDFVNLLNIEVDPLFANVEVLPSYSLSKSGAKGDWRAKTCRLAVGDIWQPRGVAYEVVSIVPPQEVPSGNVVGWVELRLLE